MSRSGIEWTDRSDWNPVRGCTRVSPGCGGPGAHGGCYAEAMAARFSDPGQWGHGFAERTPNGGRWTGNVDVQWERAALPLTWAKPVKIFANSTSDWFHEKLVETDVASLFGVAIAAVHLRGHIFQILTKRADRMRELLCSTTFWETANAMASLHVMDNVDPLNRRSDDARATLDEYGPHNPPPGIWLGVSAEDQPRADERVPDLLATPAAVRFVSCEPLLAPVNLRSDATEAGPIDWCRGYDGSEPPIPRVDWVICGGESGPNARPMRPEWARSLRDQCAAAGVPFFFKQQGEWLHENQLGWWPYGDGALTRCKFQDDFFRVGKKAAGALLDGREHREFPQ